MSCANYTLAGLAKSCEASKGGIVDIWVADYVPASAYTIEPASSVTDADVITKIDSACTFYHFNVRKGTCSMTSTLNVDSANGVNYVSTELSLQFTRMEAKKRLQLKALAMNELTIIVKDANGEYWVLGEENPVLANGGASQTGQAIGDGNFYQITFTDENSTYPKVIKSDGFTIAADPA